MFWPQPLFSTCIVPIQHDFNLTHDFINLPTINLTLINASTPALWGFTLKITHNKKTHQDADVINVDCFAR